MSAVAINVPVVITHEKLIAQINACFAAKRVVSLDVENQLDDVIDLLDDILQKVSDAENKRSENED